MKKTIFVSLVAALLFILPALADSPESISISGVYVRTENVSNSMKAITLYQFFDDHTVYYFGHSFYFSNFSDHDAASRLFTWDFDGEKIIIRKDDQITNELYYIDDSCLSEFPSEKFSIGQYACFYKAQKIENQIHESATISSPPAVDADLCGKWSFVHDFTSESSEYFDYNYISIDLFVFPDGSVYMILGTKNKKSSVLNFSYSDGLWIGDSSFFRLKTKNSTFDAWIDENDHLNLQFTESFVFPFVRIVSSPLK